MKKKLASFLLVALFVLVTSGVANAVIVDFSSNPSSNSTDWSNYVTSQGATINSNVDFDSHSPGALNSSFYTVSDGVTIFDNDPSAQVSNGAGPGQTNTSYPPTHSGEGLHAPSNYLFGSSAAHTITINFQTLVSGAGIFVIDNFNPYGTNDSLIMEAYSGINGGGSLLGSVLSPAFNFQMNYQYFFGLASDANEIGSILIKDLTYSGGDTLGYDNFMFATDPSGGSDPSVVPEPSTYLLLGSGIAGLALWRRKRTLKA